jgi:hypothetical protein
MEPWVIGLILKPLGAVLFLWIAMIIAKRVIKLIPDGKVKRILLIRLN